MYELPVEKKKSVLEATIESQALKVYEHEVTLQMQIDAGESEKVLAVTKFKLNKQKEAQKSAEKMLAELEV